MDQTAIIVAAVPTLAVVGTFLRNESAIDGLNRRIDETNRRIDTLTQDMNYGFETLIRRLDKVDDDLREWLRSPRSGAWANSR